MQMFGGYNGMGFGGGSGILYMLLIFGLIIFGVVMLFRFFSKPVSRLEGETALSIAEKRYSRGEISLKEFETLKQNLGKAT